MPAKDFSLPSSLEAEDLTAILLLSLNILNFSINVCIQSVSLSIILSINSWLIAKAFGTLTLNPISLFKP